MGLEEKIYLQEGSERAMSYSLATTKLRKIIWLFSNEIRTIEKFPNMLEKNYIEMTFFFSFLTYPNNAGTRQPFIVSVWVNE